MVWYFVVFWAGFNFHRLVSMFRTLRFHAKLAQENKDR